MLAVYPGRNEKGRVVEPGPFQTSRASLEILGGCGVAAVPVLDRAVFRLQEPEQAAVRAVAQDVAARLDRVARLHVFRRDADALEAVAAGRFKRPDVRLAALRILDLEVNPRVRQEEVNFL